jgi:hypothetical protein
MNKRCTQISFCIGELYLFHSTNPLCPSDTALWGVYDKTDGEQIFLEHCSLDLKTFSLGCALPDEYDYCRLASRSELRDYMYSFGYWEGSSCARE